jgi:hypothetical protein
LSEIGLLYSGRYRRHAAREGGHHVAGIRTTDSGTTAPSAGGSGFTVNRDNVLQIGKAFATEADRMADRLARYHQEMRTSPALGDPASGDFRNGLTAKLVGNTDSYLARAGQYVEALRSAATQCRAAALAYGYSEDEITSVFGGNSD